MAQIARIIYAGPSFYGLDISKKADEIWQPPAKRGDILRDAQKNQPRQILLIDGQFHQALAVWHKELLYTMAQGIYCIGAASMGALRAAELWRYGMVGIGQVFEMYRAGEEDDSLVALSYEETTFRPLRNAPIGQARKQADAIEALEFARFFKPTQPSLTGLDFNAINPYLCRIIDRIKADGNEP